VKDRANFLEYDGQTATVLTGGEHLTAPSPIPEVKIGLCRVTDH
jgi:hypothetical protein